MPIPDLICCCVWPNHNTTTTSFHNKDLIGVIEQICYESLLLRLQPRVLATTVQSTFKSKDEVFHDLCKIQKVCQFRLTRDQDDLKDEDSSCSLLSVLSSVLLSLSSQFLQDLCLFITEPYPPQDTAKGANMSALRLWK